MHKKYQYCKFYSTSAIVLRKIATTDNNVTPENTQVYRHSTTITPAQ